MLKADVELMEHVLHVKNYLLLMMFQTIIIVRIWMNGNVA